MNCQEVFTIIEKELSGQANPGQVASYIPELSKVDPGKFGVHLRTLDDQQFALGDFREKFSIQSIAKVLSLTLAYRLEEEKLWKRVGVEPSGTSFNSLIQLEKDEGIPRNPLINAGALVVCDVLMDLLADPQKDFVKFVKEVAGLKTIQYNEAIFNSEKATGFRNAAVVNLMKSFGNIRNEVEEVLDFYFHLCSIEMTCEELSRTFLFLVNNGMDPKTGKEVLNEPQSKRINAIMQTCGFYDEAGEFAFKVGLPGKSGVGGGIIAILPDKFSIAVWSPPLNEKGNSYKGMQFLERFTSETQLSIF